jgi:Transposase DDE domain
MRVNHRRGHITVAQQLLHFANDNPKGSQLYSLRIGTVEPVFANIRHNKPLTRFNHRGRDAVNTQWNLYCMVHNIEKLAKSGYAQYGARQALGNCCKRNGANLRHTWRLTIKPSIENHSPSNPMHGTIGNWVLFSLVTRQKREARLTETESVPKL